MKTAEKAEVAIKRSEKKQSKGLRRSRLGTWTLPGGVANPWPAPFAASPPSYHFF